MTAAVEDTITAEWIQTKADTKAVANGCYFDLVAANHARKFIETFLYLAPNKPFKLLEWQWRKVIGPLFGWKRPDGSRRFRMAYIEIPKKNGKSVLCSAISLYMLLGDGEYKAQVYNAAYTRDSAGIVFNECANMVKVSPELTKYLDIISNSKTIVFKKTASFLRALSADANTAEGLNIHGLIFDELHTQKTRNLWDALRYGGAARRQPLIVAITTAGYDKQSICWEQHEYTEKVNDGTLDDDSFYGFIAAAGADDDWTKEETWKKANPSFGITLNPIDFAAECMESQQSPAKENSFRRYRLNQWTEADVRFISMDKWNICGAKYPVDPESLKGKVCYAGLDLSKSKDVTAFTMLFPNADGTFETLSHFWLPREAVNEMRGKISYDVWERQKFIEVIPGNVVDYDVVRSRINEFGKRYKIAAIAIDPWNSQNVETDLQNDGFKVIKFQQSMQNLSAPTKELERLILSEKLHHGNNPILNWMAGCLTVKTDTKDNIFPVKPESRKSVNRIDGMLTLIMSIALATTEQQKNLPTKSVYEDRGLLIF